MMSAGCSARATTVSHNSLLKRLCIKGGGGENALLREPLLDRVGDPRQHAVDVPGAGQAICKFDGGPVELQPGGRQRPLCEPPCAAVDHDRFLPAGLALNVRAA